MQHLQTGHILEENWKPCRVRPVTKQLTNIAAIVAMSPNGTPVMCKLVDFSYR